MFGWKKPAMDFLLRAICPSSFVPAGNTWDLSDPSWITCGLFLMFDSNSCCWPCSSFLRYGSKEQSNPRAFLHFWVETSVMPHISTHTHTLSVLCREQASGLSPSPLCEPLPRLTSRACSLRLKITLCLWMLGPVFACITIWGRLSICLKFTCLVCVSVSHTAVALCIVAAAAIERDFSSGMCMRVWDEWNSSLISILLLYRFLSFIILPCWQNWFVT